MSKRKVKKFKPCKTTRYLPGEVLDYSNHLDLVAFNEHRYRVFNAKPTIDCKPFPMNPYIVTPYNKMKDTLRHAYRIDLENKDIIMKLNYIHRNGGVINSFNSKAYLRDDRYWREHQHQKKNIVKFNKHLYKLICSVKPHYPKKELDKFWKEAEKRLRRKCRYDLVVGKEPEYDLILSKEPSISMGLDIEVLKGEDEEVSRPQCFMEFKVEDGPYLGKVIIELYDDLVPVTCQNFLEICKGEGELTYRGCLLHRIVKGKFIESGDITHNSGRGGTSIYGKTFAEENHVLKHTKAGVLSMKRIPPGTENNSQFIITLTKMEKWDRMHVVFGRIIQGNGVLYKIQDYGRVIGKPYANVYICNCGVIESEVYN